MKSQPISVIDYGVGNLLSVQRGFDHCGGDVVFVSTPAEVVAAEKLVLPGVGAFPNAMESLSKLDLISAIQDFSLRDKPMLAICLGMQLLLDESEEFEKTKGIGIIKGQVTAIPNQDINGEKKKIPHIGWNELHTRQNQEVWELSILRGLSTSAATYFVHSYIAIPENKENLLAFAHYGEIEIPAVISKGNVTGCQFHPEKSGEVGLTILRNFMKI
jgi:glutamine amidotransferase